MERRINVRIASELPVEIEARGLSWSGTVINYSLEGALLKLEGRWEDDDSILLRLDPKHHWDGFASRATVVRHSSPDGLGTFLAVRF